jgi:hypothetical protein
MLHQFPLSLDPGAGRHTAGAARSDLIVGAHYLYGDQSTVLHPSRA